MIPGTSDIDGNLFTVDIAALQENHETTISFQVLVNSVQPEYIVSETRREYLIYIG